MVQAGDAEAQNSTKAGARKSGLPGKGSRRKAPAHSRDEAREEDRAQRQGPRGLVILIRLTRSPSRETGESQV